MENNFNKGHIPVLASTTVAVFEIMITLLNEIFFILIFKHSTNTNYGNNKWFTARPYCPFVPHSDPLLIKYFDISELMTVFS